MIWNIVVTMTEDREEHDGHNAASVESLDTEIDDGYNGTNGDEKFGATHTGRGADESWISKMIFGCAP
jgi:hypothetical protein